MVTKRKPVKRKSNASVRDAGHPASAANSAAGRIAPAAPAASDVQAAPAVSATSAKPAASSVPVGFRASGGIAGSATALDADRSASPDADHSAVPDASPAVDSAASPLPAESGKLNVPGMGQCVSAAENVLSGAFPTSDGAPEGVPSDFGGSREESTPAAELPFEGSDAVSASSKNPASPEAHAKEDKRGKRRVSAKSKKKNPWVRVVAAIVAAVLVLLLLVAGLYSWDRWFRYDDSLDFVGEWQIHGSQTTILIDGQYIVLSADASLEYTLDTTDKTIHFTLGNMEGGGRYCFSADRNQLLIEDGAYGSWLANAWHDAGRRFDQLMHAWFGAPVRDLSREGLSVLDRAGTQAAEAEQEAALEEVLEEGQPEAQPEGADQAERADGQQAESDSASGATEEQPAEGSQGEPEEEFQGGQASGSAGGNAITLEELQAASA